MRLEEGKYYRTRNNKKALVIWINDQPSDGAHGWIQETEKLKVACCWNKNGKPNNIFYEYPSDLISEWIDEKIYWIVFDDNGRVVHACNTLEETKFGWPHCRIICVKEIR
jgi:hypothetical protein